MEDNSALEQFRKQWREEVNARSQSQQQPRRTQGPESRSLLNDGQSRQRVNRIRPPTYHPAADVRDDEFDDEDAPDEPATANTSDLSNRLNHLKITKPDDEFKPKPSHEPQSALEHYERAVEKEIEGKLGDSVAHYRRAYRLDARVDQDYKDKHFAGAWRGQKSGTFKQQQTTDPAPTVRADNVPIKLSTQELISSFAGIPIAQAEPVIKGDRPPPCPISNIPSEIMHEVYLHAAISDPASLAVLALVCKRFAWDVFTNQSIWKRVALGAEFGVASQKYDFCCDVSGREIIDAMLGDEEKNNVKDPANIKDLSQKQQDWREFYHNHPRIRFNGVYISTVNYTRAGHGSATSAVWNTPVHIVTYYRYLRFFRDGTVISLLTTHEPSEVVHHLTKDNMELIRLHPKEHPVMNFTAAPPNIAGTAPAPHMPPSAQALMRHALRGRWRLWHSSTEENQEIGTNKSTEEGDVHIETEGVGPRYMYTMHLALRSNSRSKTAVKNTKLQWKGFWSYNHLTSDWAEFQLKNDRTFVFSRVRSYGMGY